MSMPLPCHIGDVGGAVTTLRDDILSDDILIGEGVRLESGSAPVTLRLLSGAIDALALVFLVYVFGSVIDTLTIASNDALAQAITIAYVLAVFVGVPTTVETLTRGRSLGRLALGLRMVRDDGGPVSFRHAFTRALIGLVEVYGTVGVVAVTVSLLSTRGKRIGDYLAGTYALRTRGGTRVLPPIGMPQSLAEWAKTADIRRLPDGLALTARLFLGRASLLQPQARGRLGNLIAVEFDRYVAPPPPMGTHPESFIAAVLAARRDREYALIIRQEAQAAATSELLRRLPHGVADVEN
jgi:uncharacterized RDD family membrane protein YckC